MSDNWLRIIATDPGFVPDDESATAVVDLLRQLAPQAEGCIERTSDRIEFVHAGANFDSITCQRCTAAIDMGWWGEQMDGASAGGFTDLAVTTPCCGAASTLNELLYDLPQGFARWRAEVANPERGDLTEQELAGLGGALGHPVRAIWTHL